MTTPLRLAKDLQAPAAAPLRAPAAPLWSAAARAGSGKLVELSGSVAHARISSAASAVLAAQLEGETAAWIQPEGGSLFPPDFLDCGVDLEALSVIHVPRSAPPHAAFRAAELLLRSGAFGLLVLDLREASSRTDPAWQGRLLTLAREHESRILFLTTKSRTADSLGPLIALRLEPHRSRLGPGKFGIENHVLKNKTGLLHEVFEARRGPWGLK
jgi:recombination protein RecA